jgi:hypothetical protein
MHFRDVNIILFTTKLCVYCQNFRWNILLRDLLAVRIGRIERQWPLSFSNTNFMRDILPRTPCAQPNLLGQFPTLGNVTPETWSMINRAYVINDQPRIRDQWSTAHTWSMINRAYVINDQPRIRDQWSSGERFEFQLQSKRVKSIKQGDFSPNPVPGS